MHVYTAFEYLWAQKGFLRLALLAQDKLLAIQTYKTKELHKAAPLFCGPRRARTFDPLIMSKKICFISRIIYFCI